MAVSAHAVANEFLRLAREADCSLTNMQLQKLVFLAQGYSLALLEHPVYYHRTHAWQWGPVIPKLYKSLQKYGSGIVQEDVPLPPSIEKEQLTDDELRLIEGVWRGYGKYTGAQLSEITHRPNSPWSETWELDQFGVIPNEEMQRYYAARVAKA